MQEMRQQPAYAHGWHDGVAARQAGEAVPQTNRTIRGWAAEREPAEGCPADTSAGHPDPDSYNIGWLYGYSHTAWGWGKGQEPITEEAVS